MRKKLAWLVCALFLASAWGGLVLAAEAALLFPLGRSAYQTDEDVVLAVARKSGETLLAGTLQLTLSTAEGSRLELAFPVEGGGQQRTEFLHLRGALLRPGTYAVAVEVDGAQAAGEFLLASHVRTSSFRLANWGSRARGDKQLAQGAESLGFNLVMQSPGRQGVDADNTIAAGVDVTSCCVQSGGHQMDLRMDCDWSDPYVLRGARQRAVRNAFQFRTQGNPIGVHFYDEPGLTWWKDPVTGKTTPHMVPAQVRSYRSAFGQEPLRYNEVDPENPDHVRRWMAWGRWKLSFMDAAWRDAQFGVLQVRPDYLTLTQSQYGAFAFTDGYYFNVTRRLPAALGHGGYHDWGPGYWHPSYTLELARARDYGRPCWYMPLWYPNTTPEHTRLEQYLSFVTGIQGLMIPPPMDPANNPQIPSRWGTVESNKLMARLGTIFTKLPVHRPPVALLYSISHLLHHQAAVDMDMLYAHAETHCASLKAFYLAGKLMQNQFFIVLDEDIADGTLAADHKVLLVPSVDYLAPDVLAALEAFAAQGGLVLTTDDCAVQIKGAVDLGLTPGMTEADKAAYEVVQADTAALNKKRGPLKGQLQNLGKEMRSLRGKVRREKDAAAKAALEKQMAALDEKVAAVRKQLEPLNEQAALLRERQQSLVGMRGDLKVASACIPALKAQLDRAGIDPFFRSSEPGIAAARQGVGDVEYLFAINATHDPAGNPQLGLKSVSATLTLPAAGRTVYDAVRGGPVPGLAARDDTAVGQFRFGPGAMQVFALTRRPLGSVRVGAPRVVRQYTQVQPPRSLVFTATVLDDQGHLVGGVIPLDIRVRDALGVERYHLYRAADGGLLQVTLPLAANDPAGDWTVTVTELLGRHTGTAGVTVPGESWAGGLAGTQPRAFLWEGDRETLYRFARTHKEVTLVVGTSAYNQAAAERLQASLAPWDMACTIVPAAEVAKARTLTEAEAATWVGIHHAPSGAIKPGGGNPVALAGFAVRGPVILLGNSQDNPLVKFVEEQHFLPVRPSPEGVPGSGRGLVAWQLDAVGVGQESVSLIAYDAPGMDEAVGTFYELVAGLEPLVRYGGSTVGALTPAQQAPRVPGLQEAWRTVVSDRVDAIESGATLSVLTHDGGVAVLDPDGTVKSSTGLAAGYEERAAQARAATRPGKADATTYAFAGRILDHVARGADRVALGYCGGLVRVLAADGTLLAQTQFPFDICALAWHDGVLVAALSDATVRGLTLE